MFLIIRCLRWIAKIGPTQVFALFIDVLKICADTCSVADAWGTPEKISSWLDARGADLLTDEKMLADTYAYGAAVSPLQTCSLNPLAQELKRGRVVDLRIFCSIHSIFDFVVPYLTNMRAMLSHKRSFKLAKCQCCSAAVLL